MPGQIPETHAILAGVLESLDGATNYRDWIYALARPHLDPPVLEVGAGSGTFTSLLAETGQVTAVEPAGSLVTTLRRRYAGDDRITVVAGVTEDLPCEAQFRSAVMVNVLEHIPDDAAALRAIHERLYPGGRLVLWVPAFEILSSRFDEMLGHQRRYRTRGLRTLVTSAGYTVLDARYVNIAGWFGWLIMARLLGRVPTSGPVLSIFDRVVVPVMRAIENVIRPPFGQSVFLVAQKPVTT